MDKGLRTARIRRRLVRPAAAGLGVAALLLTPVALLTAPAGATATQVGAEPGMNYGLGTNYAVGCQSAVQVTVSDPVQPVQVFDNNGSIGWFRPSGGTVVAPWTPATVGWHHITAVQAATPAGTPTPYVDIRVANGAHMGNNCAVFG
ncbi:hypothetical protein [Nocardia jiangxiensis]|uniref:Ig-like domain-containing protein n=1 Tax=Nocardia jiangxiensis TaxID=282685 RepID=A0ABW6S2Y6_9NOCA|nr:hypothetical protein [Nocardia jiangxiensis]